ncbi:hypothetical protein JDV02_004371 [Purpureocillium takamizusanense]|uniref:L-asparaginase n=1 Tax=Purpureocillium takamizusanense TaxID=2060973 RepID=A0A9Q8V9V8_9HYPO|nr:uncharacterized protein JDV02_004371 [Purpureocillium takamizusanense]UNI18078.1 hypothetical protein JDV02_004371 [Purpureocillium takamizusanense]
MEYKQQLPEPATTRVRIKPRIIIHGGAGNIRRKGYPPGKYEEYRHALLTIVRNTDAFMNGDAGRDTSEEKKRLMHQQRQQHGPTALDIATHAVVQLEDCPLFNAGHGAVFTRDGINQLEASVMVSRGRAKRGVGVSGLRRVRNPILLAKAMLERGDADLGGAGAGRPSSFLPGRDASGEERRRLEGEAHRTDEEEHGERGDDDGGDDDDGDDDDDLDVPSAQGHTMLWGRAAEQLARKYGLDMVDPSYYFTQQRWDEHIRALEREKQQQQQHRGSSAYCSQTTAMVTATWSADEYLPQGTCGAVALDDRGVICAATSTGGMTNKLTGRIGDTPVPGAGFWAEEWEEEVTSGSSKSMWDRAADAVANTTAGITLAGPLKGLLADCLPTPFLYTPVPPVVPFTHNDYDDGAHSPHRRNDYSNDNSNNNSNIVATRSTGLSGTGNGDSFLRIAAAHTVACLARLRPLPASRALAAVAGPGGDLQRSAGTRWGRGAGEGEGGIIGVECALCRDATTGELLAARSEVVMGYNCGGMYRAWIDDRGEAVMSVWTDGAPDEDWP